MFGFLLHKGGATKYDVIVGQLLLTDFTVLKIMLSAVVTGMIGIYLMKSLGWIKLSLKSGSVGMNVLGALIFGVGFAVLGYCPVTIAGAISNGYLDDITGGLAGILLGTWIFAVMYPKLKDGILKKVKAIEALFEQTRKTIQQKALKVYSYELLEVLFTQVYCKYDYLIQRKIASRNTASDYLNELTDIGILEKEKLGNVFVFKNIALYDLFSDN